MNKINNTLFWALFWLVILATCVFSGALIGLLTGWPNMAGCGLAVWFLLPGTAVTCVEDDALETLRRFVCRMLGRV